MIRLFALLLLISTPAAAAAPEGRSAPKRVLFVGNSYTYYSDLPAIVAAMGEQANTPLEVQMIALPGATLEDHVAKGEVSAVLAAADWDFVVLQEQSLRPLLDRERMFAAVRTLDAEIDKRGALTVLYLTWARRDHPEMQQQLDQAYQTIATEVGALVAPVGPVWQAARTKDPELPIFDTDGSHPSVAGTYLAACVFYVALAQPEEQTCPVLPVEGLPHEMAREISRIVGGAKAENGLATAAAPAPDAPAVP